MNSATITQDITPAERLAQIVAAGVARFESTLPAYAQRSADVEPMEACPNLVVSADRQREICLSCPLADCVGVGNDQCPIRVEARRLWKQRRESNQ
jgi:hypothetical protein